MGGSPSRAGAVAALAAPALFVLIWSTGFIAARAAVPHADPQLFLLLRMIVTVAVMAAAALVLRERRGPWRRIAIHAAFGALLPGFYLCASWWAVENGMPAGVMALLGAVQPLPIALLAFLLFGERLSRASVAGLIAGAIGVLLVLVPTLEHGAGGAGVLPAVMGVLGVVGMAVATLAQHRLLRNDPLFVAGAAQNAGGSFIGLLGWALVGSGRWDGSAVLWLNFGWSVLGLSVAGLGLLAWLVRAQGATRVSTLLLLVPALAAVEAWLLFGEALGAVQLAGFALALGGVLVARRRDAPGEPA